MSQLHEWEIEGRDVFIDRYSIQGIETMTREEAEARLNEYETLKAATERLSAKVARRNGATLLFDASLVPWGEDTQGYKDGKDMIAYADILEDKP